MHWKVARIPQKPKSPLRYIPVLPIAIFAVFVAGPFAGQSFTGNRLTAHHGNAAPSRLRAASAAQDYPDLSRVEDLIYDSCVVMETSQELECLRVWNKLTSFHKDAAIECSLDDLRCVVLDVLDRLCQGIDGKDGLIMLNKVSNAVLTFREHFTDWDKAFTAADRDQTGKLDLDDLIAVMKDVGAGMTNQEVSLCFVAADANGDGVISREEFADFLTAAVFAEEPLRELQVDNLPRKQPDIIDYLRWSSAGRTQSWAGLAKMR